MWRWLTMAGQMAMARQLGMTLMWPRTGIRRWSSSSDSEAADLMHERAAAAMLAAEAAKQAPISRRSVSAKHRKLVAYRQRYHCAKCCCLLPPDYEIDHVIPVAMNGSDCLSNLQAMCSSCHKQKTRDQRHEVLQAVSTFRKRVGIGAKKVVPVLKLNEAQQAAVCTDGTVRVVAGPGTGKTRVLISRIKELVGRGVPPWTILALTFSNKAAREMRDRLDDDNIPVGTFHRVCLTLLRSLDRDLPGGRRAGFACYDQKDMIKLTADCIERLRLSSNEELKAAKVQTLISASKNTELRLEGDLQKIKREYEAELVRRNAVDFDDMLLLGLEVLRSNRVTRRWRYVLVDELQDTNAVQYELIKAFNCDIFAVGDGDQAIYGWRGADYSNLQKFDRDFPERTLIMLQQNYRSTQQILDAATSLVRASKAPRDDLELHALVADGPKPTRVAVADQDAEARFVSDAVSRLDPELSVAVLYRTNAQSRVFESQLMKDGIGYTLANGRAFFDRREVRDLIAFLRLLVNNDDDLSCERIVNVPPRQIGKKTLDGLKSCGKSLLRTAREADATVLGTRGARAAREFASLIDSISVDSPPRDVLASLLEATGYVDYLTGMSDDARDRLRNVRELVNFAAKHDSLVAFLDECALVQDQDFLGPHKQQTIHLLTVHAAKGLEYDVVFLVGAEDGLIPHYYSMQDERNVEEERRLLYVALTRAKRHLYILHASTRLYWGMLRDAALSRFMLDLPEHQVRAIDLQKEG